VGEAKAEARGEIIERRAQKSGKSIQKIELSKWSGHTNMPLTFLLQVSDHSA
jgi:hypothetical protein